MKFSKHKPNLGSCMKFQAIHYTYFSKQGFM